MSGILAASMAGGVTELVLDITNTVNPDIAYLAQTARWLGTMQKIRVVSTGLVNRIAFPAGTILDGADITLDLSAESFVGGEYGSSPAAATALTVEIPIKVKNLGTIAGAGGRGGDGGGGYVAFRLPDFYQATYNASGGSGGRGQGFLKNSLEIRVRESGSDGTSTGKRTGTPRDGDFGGGGTGEGYWGRVDGGRGGSGGVWGVGGASGANAVRSSGGSGSFYVETTPRELGYSAGNSVRGNSFITWIETGIRLGEIS